MLEYYQTHEPLPIPSFLMDKFCYTIVYAILGTLPDRGRRKRCASALTIPIDDQCEDYVDKSSKLPAEGKQSARERIITAAEELFAGKGMHGASLREISRKAGINVNLISYYFSEQERSEEHTSELKSLMSTSYAAFGL